MKSRTYSQSLKKMKKRDVFECSINKIQDMQNEIQRSAQLNLNPKQKVIKDYVLARKQLIEHKSSKNKLQEQVDKILKQFVKKDIYGVSNNKINRKHNYSRLRIDTEVENQQNLKKSHSKENGQYETLNQEQIYPEGRKKQSNKDHNTLPIITKSSSHNNFQKLKSRRIKTEHQAFEKLHKQKRNQLFEYINIDSAIRQYRAGMTSLIRGVYYNPHNPYSKGSV